ncbi:hypothetical protein CRUP_028171 [Coryphaenoides rupestris]|nr:hypothetical protein CRUP_028171 [Coryphaenoides rupestris]
MVKTPTYLGEITTTTTTSSSLLAMVDEDQLVDVRRDGGGLDHPTVIKRRFTSVLIVSALSPAFVWTWKEFTGTSSSLLALMGIRFEGLIPAVILPLLLTMVLFLGPLIQLAMDYPWFWNLCASDMRWMRNQVVAPLTEELVFRACMLPMLVPFFQFSYTAVFGAYTAFIFIRTGHLVGPVLCHSFCNYMGFPAVNAALDHPHRPTVLTCYLLGVLLFLLGLFPLTEPAYYSLPTPVCTLAPPGLDSLCAS